MSDEYREPRAVAERVAEEAGRLLLAAFGKVEAREKGPADLVTSADFDSQRLIADRLARAFPGSTLLAEEEGVTPDPDCPWRWIVDPLDGTMNFAHGNPCWCVSIGLEYRGDPVVGVIHVPLLNTTYSAAKGLGATANGQAIRVGKAESLSVALTGACLPSDFAREADRQTAYFRRFSTGTHSLRRLGSSAWSLSLVAAGGLDICYATSMQPWDAAAGVVLVREAGGVVTGLAGEPHDLYGRGILATNGRVHGEAVRALAEAWPA
ncbi:MAG TPA: inositol monophosphatase family protein [Isosphaeraceae bacterium]|nr:inositol monophosphatase family protein [Isosphaeraceae bacterium]